MELIFYLGKTDNNHYDLINILEGGKCCGDKRNREEEGVWDVWIFK